eukprot:804895-Prorocentrum_minimum.AAC.2
MARALFSYAVSASHLEQQEQLVRMRVEVEELRAQLASKSDELTSMRTGRLSDTGELDDLREQLRRALEEVDALRGLSAQVRVADQVTGLLNTGLLNVGLLNAGLLNA